MTNGQQQQQQQQNGRSYFDLIPVDLVINILSKLPVKSIAKCRCVSKLWSSMIRSTNYNRLFPIKSPATPRLFLAVEAAGLGKTLFFYSLPQPQNLDENSSLVPTLHHGISGGTYFGELCRPVHGLVCRQHIEGNHALVVIHNPITGESLSLPKLKLESFTNSKVCFGYDPIEKQFKVLRMTWLRSGYFNWSAEYEVLTLGTGNRNLLWRKTQCSTVHYPLKDNGICINGVLYYPAKINNETYTIVCFDVRSEKFSFINIDQDLASKNISESFSLINYKGKLSAYNCETEYVPFQLWVLEDAEKHIWSKHTYRLPHPWLKSLCSVRLAGMTYRGEVVLYPSITHDLEVYYYNLKTNILTRVRSEVPAIKEARFCKIHVFSDFVEDVKLM